jgi:hypothetical protein
MQVKNTKRLQMLFDERVYSVKDAAAAIGLSPWTLWDKLKKGELMRTKVGGRTVIRESELRKLIRDIQN